MAQGASSSGILAGGYGGLGASISPTTAGNTVFTTDGSTWSSTQKIVQSASVSPSGTTAASFTSLPSWVKRVTIQFSNLTSATASATMTVQLGTGATPTYVTSGYTGAIGFVFAANVTTTGSFSSGFLVNSGFAANSPIYGTVTLTNLTGNTWMGTITMGRTSSVMGACGGGIIALSGALTAVQILCSANYNAGTVSIYYE